MVVDDSTTVAVTTTLEALERSAKSMVSFETSYTVLTAVAITVAVAVTDEVGLLVTVTVINRGGC